MQCVVCHACRSPFMPELALGIWAEVDLRLHGSRLMAQGLRLTAHTKVEAQVRETWEPFSGVQFVVQAERIEADGRRQTADGRRQTGDHALSCPSAFVLAAKLVQ